MTDVNETPAPLCMCVCVCRPHLGGDELQAPALPVLLLLQQAPHLGVVLGQTLLARPAGGAAEAPPAGPHTARGPQQDGLQECILS